MLKWAKYLVWVSLVFGAGNTYATSTALDFLSVLESPRQRSLGGSANSLPDEGAGFISNPTALTTPGDDARQALSVYATYQPLFVDYKSTAIFVGLPFTFINMGAYAQAVTSGSFDAIDKYGENIGTLSEQFSSFGLNLSKKFRIFRHSIYFGTTVKGFYSRLGEFSSFGALFDLGLNYYFKLPRLKALPYISSTPNSSISLVILNLGPGFKFDSVTAPAPTVYDLSFRYGLYLKQRHQLDMYNNFRYETNFSVIQGGGGLEYIYSRMLSFRLGLQSSSVSNFVLTSGMGFAYEQNEKLSYSADYSAASATNTGTGLSHNVGIGAKYKFSARKVKKIRMKVDHEILYEMHRFVQNRSKEPGKKQPATMDEIIAEMESSGYPKPQFTDGKAIFVPNIKKLVYVSKSESADNPDIIFTSSGIIRGRITGQSANSLLVRSTYGELEVPFRTITRIKNGQIGELDSILLQKVRKLVADYRKRESRYPSSLDELRSKSTEELEHFPEPVEGKFDYNPLTGKVILK